ncbi:MAG: sugar phosphate nucleotidyltransferase, partial [Rhizobacter sp.]
MQDLMAGPTDSRLAATPAVEPTRPQQITVQPVIMAGGVGTRLWPLSREQYPKQFLALSGKETLLQQAVSRGRGLAAPGRQIRHPLVV